MKGGYTLMDKLWIKILIIIALQIAIIFNRRILEVTEKGELVALLFLYTYGLYPTVLLR